MQWWLWCSLWWVTLRTCAGQAVVVAEMAVVFAVAGADVCRGGYGGREVDVVDVVFAVLWLLWWLLMSAEVAVVFVVVMTVVGADVC